MTVEQVAPGVTRFHKADREYAARLDSAPDQYVVNQRRSRGNNSEVYRLHYPECSTIAADRATKLTANEKWCGSRQALEEWVTALTGGPPQKCATCFG